MRGFQLRVIPEDTSLRGDLALSDEALNARYAKQWAEFERDHWWPWYEQWGPQFFAAGSPQAEVSPKDKRKEAQREKV